MSRFITFRLHWSKPYRSDAIKYGSLICGPEWAAEINSAIRYRRGHGVATNKRRNSSDPISYTYPLYFISGPTHRQNPNRQF